MTRSELVNVAVVCVVAFLVAFLLPFHAAMRADSYTWAQLGRELRAALADRARWRWTWQRRAWMMRVALVRRFGWRGLRFAAHTRYHPSPPRIVVDLTGLHDAEFAQVRDHWRRAAHANPHLLAYRDSDGVAIGGVGRKEPDDA